MTLNATDDICRSTPLAVGRRPPHGGAHAGREFHESRRRMADIGSLDVVAPFGVGRPQASSRDTLEDLAC